MDAAMDSVEVVTRPETLDELVERIEAQHAALPRRLREIGTFVSVSYTHLTLPTKFVV